ncbi:MAG TPA: universal stress protein [Pseudomonadales bacterium]|jgi:universal stress protein A
MSIYRHILVAVDLSNDAEKVVEKAKALAHAFGSTLSLVHVIEPLSYAYGGDLPVDFSGIQEEILKQAKQKLATLAARANVPDDRCHLPTGKPSHEIQTLCESLKADVVVIGSHGRHGLALLLGSTANALLHGTKTDVLAVRVGE